MVSTADAHNDAPSWLADAEATGQRLDVRPMLAAGEDPLLQVFQSAMTVAPDGFLVIDAPFNPTPLRGVMAGQGFSSYGRRLGDRHWRIFLRRDGQGTSGDESEAGAGEACAGGADAERRWDEDGFVHLDVRGLAPPLPMLSILRLVRGLDAAATLIVHHEREPVYLVPELAELGWTIEQIPGDPGEVRLKVSRMAP